MNITDEEHQRRVQALERAGGNAAEAARELGIAPRTMRDWRAATDPAIQAAKQAANTALEPALVWAKTKSEDGTSYSVLLKPPPPEQEDWAEVLKAGLSDCPRAKPAKEPDTIPDTTTYYPIADLHLGMSTWAEETGQTWNVSRLCQRAFDGMEKLTLAAPPSHRAVILDLGDTTHADDQRNITPKSGHQLDVEGRYFRNLRATVALSKHLLDLALGRHRHVTYRILRGNHSPHTHVAVTLALAEHYADEPRVTIEASPSDFFIDHFGVNMVMGHHGDKAKPERLVLFAADEHPEVWGATKHRFFWTGHVHHDSAKDIGGMKWESFRTIIPRDAHAYGSAYTSRQTMRAITLDKQEGEILRNAVNF